MTTQYATPTGPGGLVQPGFMEIQANAIPLDGFIVRDDFIPVIRRYVREETTFWQLIKKVKAQTDVIKEIIEPSSTAPAAGFVDRVSLNPPANSPSLQNYDLSDPGQQNKAIGGVLPFPHYTRSLYSQQGRPYGDTVARKTERLLVETLLVLERSLFVGDATTNPLAFNGIENQMPLANVASIDIRLGQSVVTALRTIVRRAISNEFELRTITHIWTSALGIQLIETETDARLAYRNMETIRPGLQVPMLVTQAGTLPLMQSPYIRDTKIIAPAPDPRDEVVFYLLNMKDIEWHGVVPEGGKDTLEPQIFDVSKQEVVGPSPSPYQLEKRMTLMYGTLYVYNRGRSMYKLVVKVPAGMIDGF